MIMVPTCRIVMLRGTLLAAILLASAAWPACAPRPDCVPRLAGCKHVERFGGALSSDSETIPQKFDDCSNSLVITTDAASFGFVPGAAAPDAPSFVKQRSSFAGANDSSDEIESAAAGNPDVQGENGQPFTPLTKRQKFQIFARSTHDPATFISAGFDAMLSQISGDNRAYGMGAEGYGKRYGAALADSESGVFFAHFLFPVLYRQDPRYLRLGHGTLFQRGWYAVTRVLITKNDEGNDAFNFSHITGRFASKALSNAYYPVDQRGVFPTLRRTVNGLVSDAGSYVFKEFWPDFRRKVLPDRMKHAADNLSLISPK